MLTNAAIGYGDRRTFELKQVKLADLRDDEVLVKIAGVGVCHTDMYFRDEGLMPSPCLLGHEGSGVVVEVGAGVTKLKVGDRVALTFNSCGRCANCLAGAPAYCEQFVPLNFGGARPDGSRCVCLDDHGIASSFFGQSSFADHAIAYERNAVKVEDSDLPLELLGPLGCGFQTGAGAIMRSFACPAGSSLLIIGGGAVGLAAVMGAVIQGCNPIIVAEPHAARRELALELGAHYAFDPLAGDSVETVRRFAPRGINYAFDTTGRPESFQLMLATAAMRGHIGLVSALKADTRIDADVNQFILQGLTLQGIIEGDSNPDEFIPELIAHYRAGRFPFDRLVRTYPLADINKAIEDQHHGDCVKVILIP